VNSTMAASLVAAKLGVRIAHVEAGLRSNDRRMPEEINRLVTDRLADLLLIPSRDAAATLLAEGEPAGEIVFVGNVMIDTLFFALDAAKRSGFRESLDLAGPPLVVTLHRPSNVDDPQRLEAIASVLRELAAERPVVFPVHPRTRSRLTAANVDLGDVRTLEPVGYLQMLDLVSGSAAVITDSGGLQEETTALGIPCFTVRENTERPITVTEGTNQLTPSPEDLRRAVRRPFANSDRRRPDGWDGGAGRRVIAALEGALR
jgi:UDP-N-acetylglucosamine 2-epimerase (non-hydrolysing)